MSLVFLRELLDGEIVHIVIAVYIGVVYDFASLVILTVTEACIVVRLSALDHGGCGICEGTIIVTVERWRKCIAQRAMSIAVQLKVPFCFGACYGGCDVF
jgi:hypothetical protein